MPNGVICGGASEGSNHDGEIVTCQAMTIRPEGAGSAASETGARKATGAASSEPITARRDGQLPVNSISPSSRSKKLFFIEGLRRLAWLPAYDALSSMSSYSGNGSR